MANEETVSGILKEIEKNPPLGVPLDAVGEELKNSEEFCWSWGKSKKQPVRHVAIVLYFDRSPKFLISFRPATGVSKVAAILLSVNAQIIVEQASGDYVYFKEPCECRDVSQPDEKEKAKKFVERLLTPTLSVYNVFTQNCRDHVKGVFGSYLNDENKLDEFDKQIKDLESVDFTWWLCGTVIVGGIVHVMYSLLR